MTADAAGSSGKHALEVLGMKILIYGVNYAPELTGIGNYSGEMAEWLAE